MLHILIAQLSELKILKLNAHDKPDNEQIPSKTQHTTPTLEPM